jgi:hypothetical protein
MVFMGFYGLRSDEANLNARTHSDALFVVRSLNLNAAVIKSLHRLSTICEDAQEFSSRTGKPP